MCPTNIRINKRKGLLGATLGDLGFPRSSGLQVEPILQVARFSCGWCFSVGEPDLPEVQSWAAVIEQTQQPTNPSGWVVVRNASDRDRTPDSSSLQVTPLSSPQEGWFPAIPYPPLRVLQSWGWEVLHGRDALFLR